MLSKSEKQELADPTTLLYGDLETLIMQNIIRHVQNYDQLIDSDTWLLQKLAEIGKLNAENMKLISRYAGLSATAVQRMLDETADIVMERVEPGLNALERRGVIDGAIPANKSKNVKASIKAVKRQAWDSLNACNTTMLYKSMDAYKKLVNDTVEQAKEIENKQEFLDTIGKHVNAQAIGAESRQQAIRNTIKEFNERGIPAFVDKSGREWEPEAYVSMTLRTTAGNTATETMMARMEDRGLSLIQVSEHPGSRPKCAKDQGKIFDRNNGSGYTTDLHGKKVRYYPLRESSYGEPDGLFGINCGHHGVPFIPGVSIQRYFPTKDMEENDALYKKIQTQRSMERAIRKQKRLCTLYDETGDTEAFEKAAVRLKSREAQIKEFTDKNPDLVRRKDREQVVGFDRKVSARAVSANKKNTK
ncbi:phage minor capsid protein [bacterium]|nr:phage minor capsid protein [bacterium]MDY3022376.1 phage minor capsid protein [Oliverpabstia sp.]